MAQQRAIIRQKYPNVTILRAERARRMNDNIYSGTTWESELKLKRQDLKNLRSPNVKTKP